MVVLWCKICNRETTNEICELCGNYTEHNTPYQVYWCNSCKTPIIKSANGIDRSICPLCGAESAYLCVDLRPVFPEERLLFELLTAKPFEYIDKTVWASDNRYYIDGVSKVVPISILKKHSPVKIIEQLVKYKDKNNYYYFNQYIDKFIKANVERFNYIYNEATEFIKKTAATYPRENVVISFSGGKDSTATADLTISALSDPSLVHIFGDTTLEFPFTIEYVKRYRENIKKQYLK